MKDFLARLNSTERRFVVGVFVVFVIVINVLFIWPRFKDWDAAQARLDKFHRTLGIYKAEIKQMPDYERKVRALEGESAPVPLEDQGIEFVRNINNQAAQSGFSVVYGRMTEGTNQIFLEKSQPITLVAEESQLVDFLYNLGTGTSLIRARSLRLSPDPPRQKLSASITLVASYQKKTAARSSVTNTATAKTATSTKK
jgi:type II secretory pathway component PulM